MSTVRFNALDAAEIFPASSVAVTVKEFSPSDNSELGVIENIPVVASAVVVPRDTSPLNSSTVLPASAIPSIVGVASFVSDVVVIIDGLPGAVVSIVIDKASDASEVFPATS